ncbi:excisionase family DNA-binding protein, partial [candidate division KSB1 bacterium]|nr:excisionase family DNA-binding protein [candidate division KSB1 bacterium]
MMKKDNIEPRLLTTQQVAKYMNIPLSTIYAMVQRKQIPFKRFGTK